MDGDKVLHRFHKWVYILDLSVQLSLSFYKKFGWRFWHYNTTTCTLQTSCILFWTEHTYFSIRTTICFQTFKSFLTIVQTRCSHVYIYVFIRKILLFLPTYHHDSNTEHYSRSFDNQTKGSPNLFFHNLKSCALSLYFLHKRYKDVAVINCLLFFIYYLSFSVILFRVTFLFLHQYVSVYLCTLLSILELSLTRLPSYLCSYRHVPFYLQWLLIFLRASSYFILYFIIIYFFTTDVIIPPSRRVVISSPAFTSFTLRNTYPFL